MLLACEALESTVEVCFDIVDISKDSDSVVSEFVGIGGLGGVGNVVDGFQVVGGVERSG